MPAPNPDRPLDNSPVKMPSVDAARVREALSYNALTGEFRWRQKASSKLPGSIAGTTRPDGRRQIGLDGRFYLAARLAWLYVYGEWPEPDVDHKNHNRGDDRLANLREASRAENVANRQWRRGFSRYKGVSKKRGKWAARIHFKGQAHRLGVFATEREAAVAYNEAARRIHGEYAALNSVV